MDLETFLEHLNSGKPVRGGSEAHLFMHGVSQEALRLTAEINGSYHPPEELRALFSQLIGRPVDESFGLFPPFYTDCGKNIHIGKNVFINMGCKFQDQGGIFIGDGALIGHNVVRQRYCSARRDHRRRRYCGSRGGRNQRHPGKHHCGRRACKSYTNHQ